MSTLHPTSNATAPVRLPAPADPPMRRRRVREDRTDLAPGWAQLAAAIVATSLIWLAAGIVAAGWLWAALLVTVLGVAIFAAAVLPDVLAARWDAARALQDTENDDAEAAGLLR